MTADRPSTAAAARAALGRGDLAHAARLATIRLSEPGGAAEGQFLLGIVEAESGRIRPAIEWIERAVALAPAGEYRAQLARLYTLVRREGDAAVVLCAAEDDPPQDALSRDTIGCVYARLGDHHAALPHFTVAVALAPDNDRFLYNQAATLSFLGLTDAAEAALETLIARAPDDARAHHLLAGLRKQTATHNHIDRLSAAHDRASADGDRLLTGYALAKELEDIGRGDEALARLTRVNAAHRAVLGYDVGRDTAIFAAIEAAWPAMAAAPIGDPSPAAPILVIGMPRTGTTLVDRILASHPDVESVGELQALPLAVKAAAGTRSRTVLDPETIRAAAGADLAAIGRDYLARADHHRRMPDRRFVDKFPGNFHYAGIAARALPNATLVCLRRNPMDTVLANFRNLFAIGSRYYDYSYDLLDIAAYYAAFDALMAVWHRALPGRILELRYEALVADQEGETRRLLAHCGLDWFDGCLDFHTNTAAVSTPSAAQVRRPIYRDSVARWRRHAAALAPVAAFFAERGIAID
ncbi:MULTISPECIES: tetratricopeptide repeat-containing sulfotransferase family protein [unclassified Sphingomonas]|uniref:tetratricopeptide repeat-containing sulfotransferase family protein n=1 Tax=unclassified Sphingomonas TaxID=196159 RepID=UPI0025D1D002|nr:MULTISPECIES: tetratricopeptide repeat-containing sulfotransferase family protein [unclassified Sphingomonas]